ncbi:aminotransferase class I/II-fold pyridoxal phosphate-dependent enzyme [Thiomicrorhabdus sp.]|uniref:aminotransferase class I/II-fold pyridoxal phosphate-dependent enzyme n=1 Tax=Thiomicrorhabdus sp. TaxID=2039724 RepID=UPI002AA60E0B|nr:aminotransferase class I/II-fold pyridoxal phosphate-dependent enzyme [Thiomicrorhabdus sp.]
MINPINTNDNSVKFIPQISTTAAAIQPFHVMKILGEAKALEAQGKEIIHMEIGEPDYASLDCVHDAAYQAVQKGLTHYTPTLGLPALRQKLADFYQSFYHANVDSQNIMITPGSSTALQLVLTAILNPGDKVILCDPTYPCNRQFVHLLQADLLSIPVSHETNYQLNLELLKQHWQPGVKAVMVASPANPTGTVIEQTELLKMAQFLAKNNAYFIVDEIYQGLVYNRPAESILSHTDLPENVIVINSFSKYFGMTGWRLGWTVAPMHLIPILDRLGQNLFLAAPTPSQYGALRVLEKDALALLDERRQKFEERRNTLVKAMLESGFELKTQPQGAFYLYWDVSSFTQDAAEFCNKLLHETGVAITPGKDFGNHKANQHVRLAYTTDKTKLLEAVKKTKQFVETFY